MPQALIASLVVTAPRRSAGIRSLLKTHWPERDFVLRHALSLPCRRNRKGCNAMRIDSTRLISGTLRLSIFVAFLLVVSFLRYDFVHGAAAQERRVVFVHVGFKFCSDGRTINWGKTGESWIN